MLNKTAGRNPAKTASLERTADLVVFEAGVAAYRKWLLENGQDVDADAHSGKADQITRRYKEPIRDMIENQLGRFAEHSSGGRLRISMARALRPGNINATFDHRVNFYEIFFRWASTHVSEINEVFAGKTRRSMRTAIHTYGEEDSSLVVNRLASLPSLSGTTVTRRWLKNAAVLVGAPVKEITEDVADQESAKVIATQIQKVKAQADVEDPVSEAAADKAFDQEDLLDDLDETVKDSAKPEEVRTNITDVLSEDPLPEWVRSYGLNDEQMRVLLAEGKVVVNAGAGSGKTHTLVAKIGYAVKELDMTPAQILAVSFTKNSAEELKERVKDKFAFSEKSIGQTMNSLSFTALIKFGTEEDKIRIKNFDFTKMNRLEDYAYKQLSVKGDDVGDTGYMSRGKRVEPNPVYRYQKRAVGIDDPAMAWVHEVEIPVDGNGKPVSISLLKTMIAKWTAKGLSPEAVVLQYKDSPKLEEQCAAAMYATYAWLKENDASGPLYDFDDMQRKFRDRLVEDDKFRSRYQRMFRMVLVDEAQDTNPIQHEIFDILGEKADVLAYIGDDRQCVAVNTPVMTPTGDKKASSLKVGDPVYSYRNGSIVPQVVTVVQPSTWTSGYKITTEGGKTLTMSPNHKIWATAPTLSDEEHLVYLMYREDMGYRVGMTSTDSRNAANPWGSRPHHEKADRLWVLNVCATKEEALYKEYEISLTYGVPTQVFQAESRGINPDRIAKIFTNFGQNGSQVLEAYRLRFDLPHWMSGSYSKHEVARRTIRMNAHSSSSTQVTLEWTGSDLEILKQTEPVYTGKNNRIRRYFASYQSALEYAEALQVKTGANLCRRLSTPEGMLNLLTASGLHAGMEVAVAEGVEEGVVLDRIVSVEEVEGEFVDLQVDDASNFFGGGILSHNSIYKFRGAEPQLYIDKARSDFQELRMEMNYRSGANIVNAGEDLIEHNGDRQLAKTCRAYEANGEGNIEYIRPDTHESAAKEVVLDIRSKLKSGEYAPRDFGIVTRTNAEKDAYLIALISAGIPFETKGGIAFFGKPIVKSVLAWARLVSDRGDKSNLALADAIKTPNFKMLGRGFLTKLGQRAKQAGFTDWCEYLIQEQPVFYPKGTESQNSLDALSQTVETMRSRGTNDFGALLEYILEIQGTEEDANGGRMSFMDKLVNKMDLDLLRSEQDLGDRVISRAELETIAKAPLNPLTAIADVKPDVGEFLKIIDMLTAKESKAKDQENTVLKGGRVLVNTCHQWKGLEAQELYVLMAGGVWPNAMSDDTDEERRLAYVGITRGKQAVTVVSPHKNYLNKDSDLSQFVSEACIRSKDDVILNRKASAKWSSYSEEDEFGAFVVDHLLGYGEES